MDFGVLLVWSIFSWFIFRVLFFVSCSLFRFVFSFVLVRFSVLFSFCVSLCSFLLLVLFVFLSCVLLCSIRVPLCSFSFPVPFPCSFFSIFSHVLSCSFASFAQTKIYSLSTTNFMSSGGLVFPPSSGSCSAPFLRDLCFPPVIPFF